MKTICVDFDGVIHSYDSGWRGVDRIPDPPVPGALAWLSMIRGLEGWEFKVYSTRCADPAGLDAIAKWFMDHGLPLRPQELASSKPPAVIYVDDRGFRFEGTFPTLPELEALLTPWNKKEGGDGLD